MENREISSVLQPLLACCCFWEADVCSQTGAKTLGTATFPNVKRVPRLVSLNRCHFAALLSSWGGTVCLRQGRSQWVKSYQNQSHGLKGSNQFSSHGAQESQHAREEGLLRKVDRLLCDFNYDVTAGVRSENCGFLSGKTSRSGPDVHISDSSLQTCCQLESWILSGNIFMVLCFQLSEKLKTI